MNQKEFLLSLANSSLIKTVYQYLQLGSFVITNHPIIGHIPTDSSKLFPFLNNGVEVSQRVKEFLEILCVVRILVLPDAFVDIVQIGLQALWILSGDLDSVLENGNGELRTGHAGEPESVSGVD
jgi:hypothetical protein